MEEADRKLCLGFYSSKISRLFLLASHGGWKKSFTLQANCFSVVKSKADFLLLGLQFEVGVESLFAPSSATVQPRQTKKLTPANVIPLQLKNILKSYIICHITACSPLEVININS